MAEEEDAVEDKEEDKQEDNEEDEEKVEDQDEEQDAEEDKEEEKEEIKQEDKEEKSIYDIRDTYNLCGKLFENKFILKNNLERVHAYGELLQQYDWEECGVRNETKGIYHKMKQNLGEF